MSADRKKIMVAKWFKYHIYQIRNAHFKKYIKIFGQLKRYKKQYKNIFCHIGKRDE